MTKQEIYEENINNNEAEIIQEPTEFEKTIQNITNIQAEWNKPQEEVTFEPYVPTQEELDLMNKQNRISELKSNLDSTDYKAIKYAEGQMSAEEYEPIKQQRQEWRDEINKLEV